MTDTYKKYIYNQFREAYSFSGMPIEIYLRGKKKKQGRHHEDKDISDGVYVNPDEDDEVIETVEVSNHQDDEDDFEEDSDDGYEFENEDDLQKGNRPHDL
jgi:GTP-binding protein